MLNLLKCPIDGSKLIEKWKCERGHSFVEMEGIINFVYNDVKLNDILERVSGIYENIWAPLGLFVSSGHRYSEIMNNAGKFVSGDTVIDIGTGTGKLFDYTICNYCFGVDISSKFLRILKKKRPKIVALRADVNKLPFNDEVANGVSAMFMLHLLPSKVTALREIYRVLKPKGKFVSSILTRNNAISSILASWWKVDLHQVEYYVQLFNEIGFSNINYVRLGAWSYITCTKT
ncbi:hypothetical protein SUSAZ_00520 [Sulfolobus acidocaldarius SUSAZ]|nr:hypothetical protein SUSAZ_00520 [Sulfolobus acidocaldarius SUSAZ]